MARSEARIYSEIWEDADFIELNATAQRLYMFLLSQPDLAHSGVIPLRERRWARKASGMTADDIEHDLKSLEDAHFVVVDWDTEELLIRSFMRRDKVYRQPNVMRAAVDHIPLIASRKILDRLLEEVARITGLEMTTGAADVVADMHNELVRRVGTFIPRQAEEGMRNPSGNPSADPSAGRPGDRGSSTTVSTYFPVPRSSDSEATSVASLPSLPPPAPRAAKPKQSPCRIPDDFAPSAEDLAWARSNAPGVEISRETQKFIYHWQSKSKNATKVKWGLAWRNWLLNAVDYANRGSPRAAASPGHQLFNPEDH